MAAGAFILLPVLPRYSATMPETDFDGVIIRGTRDGRIIASYDDGASWEQWMDFGSMIEVISLRNHAGQLDATLRLGEHEFYVRSENGRIWKT
jgi:hypothetical protein